ncbi:putative Gnk2-like domain-containing protein [Medicago truncatula]|uniref:Cysteine-rich RLK (Receptor-like kinase) protein n=1 Tax=Medicago truncatula TaxID=3880 RepID=G8A0Z3_MEDTR|nr:cysteine-rich repeat secretory protein 38 [Medicago truncatula]KEH43974.1 cysteine-rich RLK (receptor-like kinase) protein [Medicago truncatula]RHN82141.1 putative Gnk2-like domain-containing protein [Medicago truncatula]
MATISVIPYSFLILIILFTSKVNADDKFTYLCDKNNDRGDYITGSTYHNNLKIAFIYLTFNSKVNYGFYNTNYGQNEDKVNLIGICRGDINPEDCRKCLVSSKSYLTEACPNKKEAIGWYEADQKCMLRYSDRSILGLSEMWPAIIWWNVNNATLADQFNSVIKQLLNDLKNKAINGDSHRKYAVGTLPGPSSDQTINGLVQCTPDLSVSQCDDCLNESIAEVPKYCTNKIGCRVFRASCNLRFETYQFYQT